MVSRIEALLGSGEISPQNPDVIVPLGYGSCKGELMDATWSGITRAGRIVKSVPYPNAVVAFGNSSHCFLGSDEFEHAHKISILRLWGIPDSQVVSAGPITNTITELLSIKEELNRRAVYPKEVLFLVNPLHSRSVLYIAGRIFPGVTFSVNYSSISPVQPNAVFWFQRKEWRWLLANVLRYAALRVFGLECMRSIKSPSNSDREEK